MADPATAILLGIVEGVTEFLPVSSTGHLVLAGALLGYDEKHWAVFNIVIQLGAILAIVVLYWRRFWDAGMGLIRREPAAYRFFRNILVAFLPAAVIGLALHKKSKALLLHPLVVLRRARRRRHRDPRRAADQAFRPLLGGSDEPAHRARHRLHPVPGDDPGRQPLGRDDPRRADARRRAPHRRRVQLLPGDPDHARRDHARAGQERDRRAYPAAQAEEQAARCSQCGVPFCQVHCPLHNNIPDWLKLTAEGRLEEAYELSSATNNLPEICGRICPQDRLCEGNCVIEKSGHGTVTIGSVEKFITDTAWEEGWVEPLAPRPDRGQSVGIIGAGPAGSPPPSSCAARAIRSRSTTATTAPAAC